MLMAQYYLLSTLAGLFLLDEDLKLVSREDFPLEECSDQYEGEWLDAERKLIAKTLKKSAGSKVIALGTRKGKAPVGAECSDDPKLRARVSEVIEQSAEARQALRDANLDMTRRSVKDSFSEDHLIIHSARMIDDMNRAISMLGKRFHEWLSLNQPELAHRISDHERLVQAVLDKEGDKESKMGAELSKEDCAHLRAIAASLKQCYAFRKEEVQYLESKMVKHCPNIIAITGARIGGKLLSKAGSLERMAFLPSSTIQMLGAEKALFRHLLNPKAKPPKYGILHEHPLIKTARRKDHGKIARALADKIAVAARVDFFKGEFVGDKLVKAIEKRFGPWQATNNLNGSD